MYISKFFKNKLKNSTFIFVSEWMYDQFRKNIKLDEKLYEDKSYVIYNSLGEEFLNNSYDYKCKKEYDFITIRNILDGSKYCIDIVNKLAQNNPNYKFLVVGKGNFFEHNKPPKNLKYELKNLTHKEILQYLNKSKCALMPTRADAQGVMMCEMATFGIPSDIYVCRKVLEGVENVKFIKNEDTNIDLGKYLDNIENVRFEKNKKFSYENTILREIEIFNKIMGENSEN